MTLVQSCAEGALVRVLVQPRASRNHILGEHNGALKVQLTAPPIDGKANSALITFLAKQLGLCKRDVEIRIGMQSRHKTVLLRGMSEAAVRALLLRPD